MDRTSDNLRAEVIFYNTGGIYWKKNCKDGITNFTIILECST